MMLSYGPRLLCLALACFFLIHLALSVAVSALSPLALQYAARMRARRGADFLLTLRLAPAGLAAAVVLLLCVPAYLTHEPWIAHEQPGALCLAAGLAGLLLWSTSAARAIRAAARSARFVQECLNRGRRMHLPGEEQPVCVMASGAPSMMLAGVTRPTLIVSRDTLQALTSDQLAAALRHEQVHRSSRDNLKRLLLLAIPGALPGWSGMRALEHAWSRHTEWAADEEAVAGDTQLSLSLAAALVRVTRLGGAHPRWLVTSPITGGQDLSTRIERLLHPPALLPAGPAPSHWMLVAGTAAACVSLLAPAEMSESVHSVLEQLMR